MVLTDCSPRLHQLPSSATLGLYFGYPHRRFQACVLGPFPIRFFVVVVVVEIIYIIILKIRVAFHCQNLNSADKSRVQSETPLPVSASLSPSLIVCLRVDCNTVSVTVLSVPWSFHFPTTIFMVTRLSGVCPHLHSWLPPHCCPETQVCV